GFGSGLVVGFSVGVAVRVDRGFGSGLVVGFNVGVSVGVGVGVGVGVALAGTEGVDVTAGVGVGTLVGVGDTVGVGDWVPESDLIPDASDSDCETAQRAETVITTTNAAPTKSDPVIVEGVFRAIVVFVTVVQNLRVNPD